MHLDPTTTKLDNNEQRSTSFSDLYNLCEIIGKSVVVYVVNTNPDL